METNTTRDEASDVDSVDEKCHEFMSPWHFSDVVLVVEDSNFHVHKCILSMWSPVFQTMFTSKFLESAAKEIPLPGKSKDAMEELLKLVYSSEAKELVTEENHECLLEFAREYQMDKVREYCCEYLTTNISEDNCLRRYKVAERFELEDVMEECNKIACFKSSTDLEGSEEFNDLKPESKFKICMKRIKELEKTLEEYVKTCSKLVRSYYAKVFDKAVITKTYDNQESHGRQDPSNFRLGVKMFFDLSCQFCMNKVNGVSCEVNNSSLRMPLAKLYNLHRHSRVVKRIDKEK